MHTAYGRTAWLVWAAGIFVYAVAMMHRASLGAAGLEAAEHFGTTPGIVYGQYGEGYLRVSLGTATDRIMEAMQRVVDWMKVKA